MSKVKVALGLSGGVDSAVSAYLLQKKGFDVNCVYLNCYDGDTPGCRGDQDRKDALAVAMYLGLPFQVLDFRKEYQAAVIDYFKKEYLAGRTPNPDVVCNRDIKFGLFMYWSIKAGFDYVATGHYAKLKWEDRSEKLDYEVRNEKSHISHRSEASPASHLSLRTSYLITPKDLHKDQTYFLWAVTAEKFRRVLFPLGNLLKTEVREIALKIGLHVAQKKDSTGICFVGEVRVEDFLKRLGVKEKIGEVVIRTPLSFPRRRESIQIIDIDSGSKPGMTKYAYKVVGRHKGVWFYTIGQRHGFSTDLWSSKMNVERRTLNVDQRTTHNAQRTMFVIDCPPLYVIGKDIKKNRLVVGFGADCYRDNFEVSECNWLAPEVASLLPWSTSTRPPAWTSSMRSRAGRKSATSGLRRPPFGGLLVRLRHGGELIECSLTAKRQPLNAKNQLRLTISDYRFTVALKAPQRGITPGQSAVFYDETGRVLGGGIIQ